MSDDKKKVISNEVDEREKKEISVENLDEVTGGAVFDVISRVPERNIDDKARDNI